MEQFDFVKKGYTFMFKNPQINSGSSLVLSYDYKVVGLKESTTNDGFYAGAKYIHHKKMIELGYIDGRKAFVILPEEFTTTMDRFYSDMKEEYRTNQINKDFEYNFGSLTQESRQGFYYGSLDYLIRDVASEFNLEVFLDYHTETITNILSKSPELQEIAKDQFKAYPMGDKWLEEVKTAYREEVELKTGSGFGVVPNHLVRAKVTNILAAIYDKKQREAIDRAEIFERAKATNQKQFLERYYEDAEEHDNSMYVIYRWALPDGTIEIERIPAH